jgi:CheY-specific phosphatase CheX
MSDIAAEEPVAGAIRDELVEPFIQATTVALGEMAGIEVAVQSVSRAAGSKPSGDICAVVQLQSTIESVVVLCFPQATAAALARRVLDEVATEPDENLIRDCMGEVANVISGQAKAMLAGTPYQLTFAVPEVMNADVLTSRAPGLSCVVATFRSELGDFALELFLKTE